MSQDPQWRRRAATGLPTIGIVGGRATSAQVIAQRKFRQSTSISEADDSLNESCDSPGKLHTFKHLQPKFQLRLQWTALN